MAHGRSRAPGAPGSSISQVSHRSLHSTLRMQFSTRIQEQRDPGPKSDDFMASHMVDLASPVRRPLWVAANTRAENRYSGLVVCPVDHFFDPWPYGTSRNNSQSRQCKLVATCRGIETSDNNDNGATKRNYRMCALSSRSAQNRLRADVELNSISALFALRPEVSADAETFSGRCSDCWRLADSHKSGQFHLCGGIASGPRLEDPDDLQRPVPGGDDWRTDGRADGCCGGSRRDEPDVMTANDP